MQDFVKQLMEAARAAGIEACEAYVSSRDSFRAMTTEGEVVEYESNSTRGLGFRGLYRGRMGYASTEAFDEEAVGQLVRGVMESAELCEDEDEAPLYDGGEPVPDMDLRSPALAQVTPQEKIDRVLAMEKLVKESDPRIDKTAHNVINTGSYTVRIVNSHGMDRSYTEDVCALYGQATARDGDFVSSSGYGVTARSFDGLDVQKVGGEVARRTLDGLNAAPVPSGKYRVVFFSEAMCDLLGVFSSIFSAETAQKGMSLLKGRVGERIAAPCVTLVDDPLMEGGMGSRPFDDEGVPSATHTVVEDGVFRTFLHNLKTARKDGVTTTGNARKVGWLFGILYLVSPILWMLPPMIYRVYNPGLEGLEAENAYLLMCKEAMPSGLLGLMLGGMIFATASSLNATLNISAGVFTNDIFKRLSPSTSEKGLMRIARWSTIGFGVLAIVVALLIPLMGGIVNVVISVAALTGEPLYLPLIWSLFSRNLNGRVILTTTVVSLAINALFKFVTPLMGFSFDRAEEMLVGVLVPALLLTGYEIYHRICRPGEQIPMIEKAPAAATAEEEGADNNRFSVMVIGIGAILAGVFIAALGALDDEHKKS